MAGLLSDSDDDFEPPDPPSTGGPAIQLPTLSASQAASTGPLQGAAAAPINTASQPIAAAGPMASYDSPAHHAMAVLGAGHPVSQFLGQMGSVMMHPWQRQAFQTGNGPTGGGQVPTSTGQPASPLSQHLLALGSAARGMFGGSGPTGGGS
jgi:hypothetical protein